MAIPQISGNNSIAGFNQSSGGNVTVTNSPSFLNQAGDPKINKHFFATGDVTAEVQGSNAT
jgi:hypothetical protein